MRLLRYFFLVLPLLAAGYLPAQQTEFPDSTIQPPPAVFDTSVQDTDYDEDYEDQSPAVIRPYSVPDTLAFREVADSIPSSLKKQKAFEYANDPAYWTKQQEDEEQVARAMSFWQRFFAFFSKNAVRAFLFVILMAVVVFIIIRVVVVNKLYIFNRSSKKLRADGSIDDAELVNDENIDEKIRKALAENDQRSAVRFHYLKTLTLLDKKGWIEYHPETTNYTYRSQVNRYAKGKEFSFLSSVYEYVWYGNFALSPQQLDTVLHNFTHFQHSLRV